MQKSTGKSHQKYTKEDDLHLVQLVAEENPNLVWSKVEVMWTKLSTERWKRSSREARSLRDHFDKLMKNWLSSELHMSAVTSEAVREAPADWEQFDRTMWKIARVCIMLE
jgi:hypothetical protein